MQELDQTRPVLHNLPAKPMKTNSTSDKGHCAYWAGTRIPMSDASRRAVKDAHERDKATYKAGIGYQGDAGDENDAKYVPRTAAGAWHYYMPATPNRPSCTHTTPNSNHTPLTGENK